jgi:hypothetical protein
MISSERLDGTSACLTIEGATDAEVFQAYVRAVLIPHYGPATSSLWTTSALTKMPVPSN